MQEGDFSSLWENSFLSNPSSCPLPIRARSELRATLLQSSPPGSFIPASSVWCRGRESKQGNAQRLKCPGTDSSFLEKEVILFCDLEWLDPKCQLYLCVCPLSFLSGGYANCLPYGATSATLLSSTHFSPPLVQSGPGTGLHLFWSGSCSSLHQSGVLWLQGWKSQVLMGFR